MTKPPATWCEVLEAEYRALHGADPAGPPLPADPDARLHALTARLHEHPTSALCLSGGGIRSATFALGVLQGLASIGVLGTIDYLSTVSGGGYTGGWFTAWLHRKGAAGRTDVFKTLDPTNPQVQDACGEIDDDHSPVERVRRTCRYLALRGGALSADMWSLVTTLLRNLVLNWLVLLPLIAAALMVPRVYYGGVQAVERPIVETSACLAVGDPAWISFVVALACFVTCTGYIVVNLVGLGARWSQLKFLGWFLVPAVGGAIATTFFWSAYPCEPSLVKAIVLSSAIPTIGWMAIGAATARAARARASDGGTLRINVGIRTILAALVAGPVMGAGAWWLGSFPYGFGEGDQLRQIYAVFAVPLLLALAHAQIIVFIGIASSELDDAVLEWFSRCGGWLGIAAAVWLVAGFLVFYTADLIEFGVRRLSSSSMNHAAWSAIVATLVPLFSSLAGMAARAGGPNARPSMVRLAAQRLGLPVVILVLLSTVAWTDLRASQFLEYHYFDAATRCTAASGVPCHPVGAGMGENTILMLGLIAVGLVMSWFVPVNRFSLHGMYRQRLIRTFLGASRDERHPNSFTGFDSQDDVRVHQLADVRPLHVINATLNAVSSTHVGRRETNAQSFTFTPLHVGNRDLGYRPAAEYGSDGGGDSTGLSLGTALAVSGAAASPAMGMYSSKARAFLLTLANARLGLWFGNPGSDTNWRTSEPPLGVGPLLRELLGLTTDHNPYVYLSDGGHYENLALWEMVARRCRYIIVADGGCDPNYTFDDLANAVRRIRLDLGIPVQFSSLDITRAGQGHGNPHAAIGKIRYSVVDGPDVRDGTILYLKATLSGDEPIDVRNFACMDPTFPHDSTGNQFFDEARFESYRLVGFHTVRSLTTGLKSVRGVEGLCDAARKSLADLQLGAKPPAQV